MSKRRVKPITPEEAGKLEGGFPDEVIEAINTCIRREMRGNTAVVLQKDIVAEILKKMPDFTSQIVFNNKWLDFESLFSQHGWTVSYDKPGYNETYEPSFTFKAKSKKRAT